MTNILLSCWEYSQNHKQVLPVMGFWQFSRLMDSKVGLSPPIHYVRSPFNRSGSCGAEQANFQHTRSEAECFNDIAFQPIRINGGGDWLEGTVSDECEFSELRLVVITNM